jgi:hypothetical protein
MTAADGLDHAVSDRAFEDGRKAGRYATVCGGVLYVGAMTEPGGRLCLACRRMVSIAMAGEQAVQVAQEAYEGRHRQAGVLRGRFRRRSQASGGALELQPRFGALPDSTQGPATPAEKAHTLGCPDQHGVVVDRDKSTTGANANLAVLRVATEVSRWSA